LEDLSGNLDGKDDGAKTGGEEDNIGGGLSSFWGTLDSNTAISLLERGGIVYTYKSLVGKWNARGRKLTISRHCR
jgi:hypothetical protein